QRSQSPRVATEDRGSLGRNLRRWLGFRLLEAMFLGAGEGAGAMTMSFNPDSASTGQETQSADGPRVESVRLPSMLQIGHFLDVAATHELPVLLTGETGPGKSFLARWIHDHSSRRDEPLLVVPCGALVASLFESELFGHVKGAFTGADRPSEGKLAAA